MCHPMLSYFTMAIHAILQRRYKLQVDVFCKVGKTFPIWTPAHLLPPMPFIAHAIFSGSLCGHSICIAHLTTMAVRRPGGRKIIKNLNAVSWKDNKFIWGAYG